MITFPRNADSAPSPDHPRPWHAGSIFGDGPRLPFTREQRRIWRARLELHCRARAITALHQKIGRALLARLGTDGQLDPAQDTLAADAGCCERTVREALRRFNRLGLVSWLRRLVRTRVGVRQTSNAYSLHLGAAPPVSRCGGRTRREISPPYDFPSSPPWEAPPPARRSPEGRCFSGGGRPSDPLSPALTTAEEASRAWQLAQLASWQ